MSVSAVLLSNLLVGFGFAGVVFAVFVAFCDLIPVRRRSY